MFSRTTEYALRTIVFLAGRQDRPAITPEIAAVTQTPPGYSAKVLQTLARAGLVSSQRGLYGGFVLTRPPEKITVLDVIQAVDPLPRIRTCPLGLKTHGVRLCPLHRELDQALALVERAFARATIAKLLEPTPGTSVALCENRTRKPAKVSQLSRRPAGKRTKSRPAAR